MEPASLTIVPDIKLPTVDGRQLSPENCVNSNKEVRLRPKKFSRADVLVLKLKIYSKLCTLELKA